METALDSQNKTKHPSLWSFLSPDDFSLTNKMPVIPDWGNYFREKVALYPRVNQPLAYPIYFIYFLTQKEEGSSQNSAQNMETEDACSDLSFEKKDLTYDQACQLAEQAYNDQKLEKSYSYFRKALELEPKDANILYNLGTLCLSQNQIAASIEWLRQSLEQNEFAETHHNIGVAYFESGELSNAARHFEKAIEIKPHFPEAFFNLGLLFDKKGETLQAVQSYQKAIDENETFLEPSYNLAHIFYKENKLKKAALYFNSAADQNKAPFSFLFNLACLYAYQNQWPQAMEWFNRCVAKDPEHLEAFSCLLFSQFVLQKYGKCEEICDLILKLDKTFALAIMIKAKALREEHKPLEAKKWLTSCLHVDPEINWALAEQCFLDKKLPRAVYYLKRHSKSFPRNVKTDIALGICELEASPNFAQKSFLRVLSKLPNNPLLHVLIGRTCLMQKKPESISYFERALKIDPSCAPAWGSLAEGYAQIENYSKSWECIQQILKINPDTIIWQIFYGQCFYAAPDFRKLEGILLNILKHIGKLPEVTFALGCFYGRVGEKDKAIDYFHRTVEIDSKFQPVYFKLVAAYKKKDDLGSQLEVLLTAFRTFPHDQDILRQLEMALDAFEKTISCPISHIVMENPIILDGCHHTFDAPMIMSWLEQHNACPLCRAPVDFQQEADQDILLKPNEEIWAQIQYWKSIRSEVDAITKVSSPSQQD